jgi:hypothetical protein
LPVFGSAGALLEPSKTLHLKFATLHFEFCPFKRQEFDDAG